MILNWAAKRAVFLDVTPAIAEYWLQHHNSNNRVKRMAVVAQYTRDIEASRWVETGDTISFDADGQLVNGQHRLSAIVAAHKSIQALVVTGLDPSVRAYVDTHAKRSMADAMDTVTELSPMGDVGSRNRQVAAAMWVQMMCGMVKSRRPTRAETIAFARKHRDAGTFAMSIFQWGRAKKPGVVVAPVIAAFARAYYHYRKDLPSLDALAQAMLTGIQMSPRDRVSVLLVDALVTRKVTNDRVGRVEAYAKTERVIKAYMDHEELTRLYAPQAELFPLPEEVSTW